MHTFRMTDDLRFRVLFYGEGFYDPHIVVVDTAHEAACLVSFLNGGKGNSTASNTLNKIDRKVKEYTNEQG